MSFAANDFSNYPPDSVHPYSVFLFFVYGRAASRFIGICFCKIRVGRSSLDSVVKISFPFLRL